MIARSLIVMLLLGVVLPAATAGAADPAMGMKISEKRCAKCHGANGKGDGPGLKQIKADVTPADWTNAAVMSKWKDEELVKIIKEGGKASGKSKLMPAYKGKLSDAEIADLVAYIRSLAK